MTKFFLFALSFLISLQLNAQSGISVNTSGATAHPSAMLDISSTDAGILIPRMTETQKNSIITPATGLLIYQTDAVTGFWYFDGTTWAQSLGATGLAGATGPTGQDGVAGFLPQGTNIGNTPYWDGSDWVVSSANIYNNGSVVGIGTNTPELSAKLDIYSDNSGLLIPRMTTMERDLINSPAQGLQIFNTTSNCLEFFIGSKWQSLVCGCTYAPLEPVESEHIASPHYIIWSWENVQGASGYKYNTIIDFATATDNGTSRNFIQAGLNHSAQYTLYIWAYNDCGHSTPLIADKRTTAPTSCGGVLTFNYNNSTVSYGSETGQNGTCWMDRNLGALAVATAHNHSDAYGDLFQWGRGDDGHQIRTSGTTNVQSSSPTPGHSSYITGFSNWYNGTSPDPDVLWQGLQGINNPCPNGWRVPTGNELNDEMNSWLALNYFSAFDSPLKFSAGGFRSQTGGLSTIGTGGRYWTSSISGVSPLRLRTDNNNAEITAVARANGMSIRCIRD